MTNIAAILQTHALELSDTPAILDARFRQSYTFATLEAAVGRATTLLERAGLVAGDAVLILQPMSAQLYVAMLAMFRLGLIAMFVDPAAGEAHLNRCCALFPPRGFVGSDRAHLLKLRSPVLRQIPSQISIGLPVPGTLSWSHANHLPASATIVPCDAETPALLTFTSGSTGQPKAALRSHGFLQAQHHALAHSLQLAAGEIDLATLPIFVLANLASGVTSLIPNVDLRFPGKINPARVLADIQTYHPTRTAASPAFLSRLVQHCEHRGISLSSLQFIFSGGAPVFPPLLERLQQVAPQAQVIAVYGSTEAEPIAHIAYREVRTEDAIAMQQGKGLLVGHPVTEIQLRILPDQWGTPRPTYTQPEFEAIALPSEQVGEIVVSGSHVLASYLHGQGNRETKFQVAGQPWHRTGDAGYLDGQGRLWLLGRCSARLGDSRGQLYPFAVETAASYQPGIARTALIQHQNKRLLVVELNAATAANSLTQLQDRLTWAGVDEYRVVPAIPVDKRHNAKIDYPALYNLLGLALP